jgi:hypothetical protein
MKCAVSSLGCVIRLIGGRVLLAATIGVFVLGISFAHAQTLPVAPPATRTINAYVMCHISENTKSSKPPEEFPSLGNQCGPVTAPWGTLGSTTYSGSSNITVNFSGKAADGATVIGNIVGTGWSSMNGYNKNFARGNASGYLYYYFNIKKKDNVTPPFPTSIPILFSARGEGSIGPCPQQQGYPYSHGSFNAYVVVGMYGTALPTYFPKDLFQIKWEGGPKQAFFDRTVTLDLAVNDTRQPYQVQVAGIAYAYSPGVTTLNVKDDCSVVNVNVYTRIPSFDQNTFNTKCAQQRKTPFPLSQYYEFKFSPNLNIN